jgi:hypothetical protein
VNKIYIITKIKRIIFYFVDDRFFIAGLLLILTVLGFSVIEWPIVRFLQKKRSNMRIRNKRLN